MIKVSVITICYNAEKTIERTIKSVVHQTFKNIEYIIIDGGSTDDTLKIIEKYNKNIAKVISEPDDGIADAFNKGLSFATGDYIQFVNADDLLELSKIKVCSDYFRNNTAETDILIGDIVMLDKKGEEVEKVIGQEPNWLTKYRMGTLNHPTFFVKKSVYNQIGFKNFRIAMDYDWSLRALKLDFKIKKIKNNIVYMANYGISNSDFVKTLAEEHKVSLLNGSNKLVSKLFFHYFLFRRRTSIFLSRFVSDRIIYLFKPNKTRI